MLMLYFNNENCSYMLKIYIFIIYNRFFTNALTYATLRSFSPKHNLCIYQNFNSDPYILFNKNMDSTFIRSFIQYKISSNETSIPPFLSLYLFTWLDKLPPPPKRKRCVPCYVAGNFVPRILDRDF